MIYIRELSHNSTLHLDLVQNQTHRSLHLTIHGNKKQLTTTHTVPHIEIIFHINSYSKVLANPRQPCRGTMPHPLCISRSYHKTESKLLDRKIAKRKQDSCSSAGSSSPPQPKKNRRGTQEKINPQFKSQSNSQTKQNISSDE